jgi:hypothetical protein
VELFGKDIKMLNFDRNLFFDFLIAFLTHPQRIDAELVRSFTFINSAFAEEKSNIYNEWFARHFNAA